MDEDTLAQEVATTKLVRSAMTAGMTDPDDIVRFVDPTTVDATDDDAIAVAVHDVLRAKPYLKTTTDRPAADIDQGFRGNAPRPITEADLRRMTPEEIVAARERGTLDGLLQGYSKGGSFIP